MMLIPYEGDKFKVTQAFKLGVHNGLDIVGLDGKTLLALCDGTVKQSRIVTNKNDKTWEWGNYVTLQADDGTQIVYAHLGQRLVSAGDRVKQGEPIGIEGNTGYSFGSHCHLEVRNSSNKVTSDCNTPKFTGIPNIVQTINIEKENEDMTRDETEKLIDEKLDEKKIHYGKDLPDWAYDDVKYLMDKGVFFGKSGDDLDLTESELKSICWIARALRLAEK